jgi:intein/homing endonuclease
MIDYIVSDDFIIEDLGIIEDWVYDIEVENNHNFFANDILVHNSCYFYVDDFVQKYLSNREVPDVVEELDRFCKEKLAPYLDKCTNKLSSYVNAYENRINFKREIIADTAFWRSSKKYAMNVWDKEGVRYSKPKLKVMGLESQQSSIPEVVQEAMKECTRIILQEDQDSLIRYVEDFETKFLELPKIDVAFITSVGGIKKYSDKDGNPIKGAGYHVKGSLAYNKLYKNGIKDGDKVSILPLRVPNKFNAEHIAFPQTGIPEEIKDYVYSKVNTDELWNKVFFNSIQLTTEAIGWKCKDEADLSEFFS